MKKFLLYTLTVLLTAALVVGIVVINYTLPRQVCRQVKIDVTNDNNVSFVSQEGILRELRAMNTRIEGLYLNNINTEKIERRLAQSEFLENVECFFNLNGDLVIEARQIVPVMRVFDGNDSYYMNRTGKRMTADGRYHVDVPVVKGNFDSIFQPTAVLPVIDFVAKNPTLNSLVTMYEARDSNNICFLPSIAGHIVNLGNTSGLKSKFDKLMLFYSKVLPEKGWETYSEITLKWDHQIVGTLRDKRATFEVEYDPEEDEQAPDVASIDMNTMQLETKPDSATLQQ